MGARGWSWDEVLPYFKKAQNQERGEIDTHGVGGPLNVADFPEQHPVSAALLEACQEAADRDEDCERPVAAGGGAHEDPGADSREGWHYAD